MEGPDSATPEHFEPPGSFTRVPGVPERLPTEYGHLESLVDAVYAAWPQFGGPTSALQHLQLKFFDRAFNVVKGIMILLEQSHWELAAPLVRQIFEMILNLEEIERGNDPDVAAVRFSRFAMLQEVRHRLANLQYDISMGRDLEATQERFDSGLEFAVATFPEFRRTYRRGARWAESWCEASTKELAQRSEHPLRVSQYEIVFRFLSAYGHGSPIAIAGTLVSQAHTDDIPWMVADDDKNTIEIIALTLSFFAELWLLCQPVTPQLPTAISDSTYELGETMRRAGDANDLAPGT